MTSSFKEPELLPYTKTEIATLARAARILEKRVRDNDAFTSPDLIKKYLQYKIAHLEHEEFGLLLMDNKHRLLTPAFTLFRGDIAGCAVPVREVCKEVLKHNAAALACYHNHPSGSQDVSDADVKISIRIRDAIDLFDCRFLDHFICTTSGVVSLAEKGVI